MGIVKVCSHAYDSTALPAQPICGAKKRGSLGICKYVFVSSHIAIRVAVNVNVVVGRYVRFVLIERHSEKIVNGSDSTTGSSNLRLFPFILSASFAARTKKQRDNVPGIRTGGR